MSMIGSGLKTWKVRKHNFSYLAYQAEQKAKETERSVKMVCACGATCDSEGPVYCPFCGREMVRA